MLELKNWQLVLDYNHMQIQYELNASFNQRSVNLLSGVTGSGKSTILLNLSGIKDDATAGQACFNGKNLNEYDLRPVSIMFQENNLLPLCSVIDNITLGFSGKMKRSAQFLQKLTEITAIFELVGKLKAPAYLLSGGQRQLVAFCRLYLRAYFFMPGEEQIILLDEPQIGLDPKMKGILLSLLSNDIHKLGHTILICCHEPLDIIVSEYKLAINSSHKIIINKIP